MNENAQSPICRPGYGASCALCCGSHNYRLSSADLESLYRRRSSILATFSRDYLIRTVRASRSNLTGSYYVPAGLTGADMPAPIVASGTQCPFTGFAGSKDTIGCMLYPDAHCRGGAIDCALSYRGKVFSCTARDTLSRQEIDYAARITGDWFYYGLLIHHPPLLHEIMSDGRAPDNIDGVFIYDMRMRLDEFRMTNPALHMIDSYFGAQPWMDSLK